MDNNFFINQLVEEGARKSLPHPVKQTALWLAGTAVYLGLLIAYEGLRPDLAAKLADTRYIPELITLTLSAISAAFAAICLSRPDQYQIRHVYKFSLSFLMLWAVTAFWGNPDLNWDVMKQAPGLAAYDCVKCIICMSFPPGLAMFWLVRKGTPTKFYWAGAMATLRRNDIRLHGHEAD